MSDPCASVVIPTMNRPHVLRRCIESVIASEMPPTQIVVCDQSSNGATRDLVRSLDTQDTEIIYIHREKPNASRARNAGIGASTCELVACIDDDCVADGGWLRALVSSYTAASGRETVSAVTGRVLPLHSEGGGVPVSSRVSMQRRYFRASEGELDRGEWAPWDIGTGANILAPRLALGAVGGFNPRLGPGTRASAAEDIDLLYRLAHVGTIIYEPDAAVYHPTATRKKRLLSRYVYGYGMGAMLGTHISAGDPAAKRLLSLYLRHQGAQAWRRGAWGPIESLLGLAGTSGALLRWKLHRSPLGQDVHSQSRRTGQSGAKRE